MIRDNRAWHGGTPNLGQYVRAIPHPGGFRLPQAHQLRGGGRRDLPYKVWEKMSEHGKHVCRDIVAEKGEEVVVDWTPDYATQTPGHSKQKDLAVAKL
jgi:hypothetical protein